MTPRQTYYSKDMDFQEVNGDDKNMTLSNDFVERLNDNHSREMWEHYFNRMADIYGNEHNLFDNYQAFHRHALRHAEENKAISPPEYAIRNRFMNVVLIQGTSRFVKYVLINEPSWCYEFVPVSLLEQESVMPDERLVPVSTGV